MLARNVPLSFRVLDNISDYFWLLWIPPFLMVSKNIMFASPLSKCKKCIKLFFFNICMIFQIINALWLKCPRVIRILFLG